MKKILNHNLLVIATILMLTQSCGQRKEKFNGDVLTKHGNPVPNAQVTFGYSVGGKNAIQATSGATTDANGHYEVNTKINRKAVIQEGHVRSDSGIANFDASNYAGTKRIVLP